MAKNTLSQGVLVAFTRTEEPEVERMGIVRRADAHLVVLQSVDDACRFDGFLALRPESIARIESPRHAAAYLRVLAVRGGEQQGHPHVDATVMGDLLGSLQREPLVTIHETDASVCWIGGIRMVDDQSVEIHLVRPNGEDDGEMTLSVNDVTMVEWGTAYEEAVRIMASTSPS